MAHSSMSLLSLLSLLILQSLVAATPEQSVSGALHLPVGRVSQSDDDKSWEPRLSDRASDDSVTTFITNNQSFYTIELDIGTPPQHISLTLDTGSSDVWVFQKGACVSECHAGSIFDVTKSKTFKNNGTQFGIQYVDTSVAVGVWAQDVLSFGSLKVDNFNFAAANASNSTVGVAGIGLEILESSVQFGQLKTPYVNLPALLKQQGVVERISYSLWLNSADQDGGAITFGAVDHAKFKGDLYTLPLIPTDGESDVSRFAVPLSGLSVYDSTGKETPFAACNYPAVFDSGSTISSMPSGLIDIFLEFLGAEQYDQETYLVDCDLLSNSDGGLGIQVGGVDITIGFGDLFVEAAKNKKTGVTYCIPGFYVIDGAGSALIGDNILRTLYVAYDLEGLELGVAAAVTGDDAASSSSLQVISTGIPGTKVGTFSGGPTSLYATTDISLFQAPQASSSVSDASLTKSGRDAAAVATGASGTAGSGGRGGGRGGSGNSYTVGTTVTEKYVIGAKTLLKGYPGVTSASGSGDSDATSTSAKATSSNGDVAGAGGVLGTSESGKSSATTTAISDSGSNALTSAATATHSSAAKSAETADATSGAKSAASSSTKTAASSAASAASAASSAATSAKKDAGEILRPCALFAALAGSIVYIL